MGILADPRVPGQWPCCDTGLLPAAGSEPLQIGRGIERYGPQRGEGIVVDQGPPLADEEAVARGDIEVVNLLDVPRRDRGDALKPSSVDLVARA